MEQVCFFVLGALILMAQYTWLGEKPIAQVFENELGQMTLKLKNLLSKLSKIAPWIAHR
jgi:hypothetical protein